MPGHTLTLRDVICPDWGALECRELDLLLRLEFDRLAIFDAKSGNRLLSEAEAAEAAREAAEKRAAAAETEVERLRQELARRKRPKN